MLDEVHNNRHTVEGTYRPFADLLKADGYVVVGSRSRFNRDSLKGGDILVISNALHDRNVDDWSLPTPSAFSDEEVAALHNWVGGGGSLLLIADHMPFPGAVTNLASTFGVRWSNGFAVESSTRDGVMVFRRPDGSLAVHPITDGPTSAEKVDSVATFWGSAFQVDHEVQPLLTLGSSMISLEPQVAWEYDSDTPWIPVEGWFQGAVMRFGEGRIAVFGEAAMFTARWTGQGGPMGMNHPLASENAQFVLNVLHWLSGLVQDKK